jgi:hypothetical protein
LGVLSVPWLAPRLAGAAFLFAVAVFPVAAQYDVTTHNGPSALNGGWITGPASNPLSFLNGPAYRSLSSSAAYDFSDFRPASWLDAKLPNWLAFAVEERLRYEGYNNGAFKSNNKDSYLLNRLRYQMTIRPTGWFKVVSQMQDACAFLQKPPYGPPNANRWDLKLAYAELGDPEKQWISVRVGRQLINYNNTLMADSEWRNQARSYDAVATNLHYDRYRLGIFAASVVNPLASGISHHLEGNNIYGLYGGIERIVPNSALEPFILWRVAPAVTVETTGRPESGRLSERAYGFRLKMRTFRDFDASWESAWERGSAGANPIRAWGTTFGAGYRIDSAAWHPRLFAQYDYASGDKNPTDRIHGTFDTIYPTAHDRFGISDQLGWQNIISVRGGMTLEPHRRWTVTAQCLDFRLANATDSLYNGSGAPVVRDVTGKSGTHIGDELDAYTWYEVNRHVNLGAGFGHLIAGAFLRETTKVPAYNYTYFAVNFKDYGGPKTR